MSRFLTQERPSSVYTSANVTDFYREEFLKYRECLEQQRECFSEPAVAEAEAALTRVMGRLETLCRRQDCDEVVSQLLKKFDVLTGLSAWTDPKTLH